MTQQHVVVARYRGVAERTRGELTGVYHNAQHAPNFTGNTKEMVSKDEEDVPSEPAEVTLPPLTAEKLFRRMETILTEAWDLMATRDRTNMDATGDIVVGGETLAEGLPLSTLLSLEKQFQDMRTVVRSMPVRDPSKVWAHDRDLGFHRAPEMRRAKTRKAIRPIVMYEATDKHPAQVQAYPVDDIVGHYVTTEFSGALSAQEKESLVDRINTIIDATRTARTEANKTEVVDLRPAAKLLGFVFGPRIVL